MNITLSQYVFSDKKGVQQVVLDGLHEFGFQYNQAYDFDLEDPQKQYIDSGGMFFVLKDDGNVIGTAAFINKGNTIAELKRLYVEKAYQGRGLGSKLLDTVITYCKEHGFTLLEFETNKKFIKAHILYQKRNFKIVREDARSYYMEKKL